MKKRDSDSKGPGEFIFFCAGVAAGRIVPGFDHDWSGFWSDLVSGRSVSELFRRIIATLLEKDPSLRDEFKASFPPPTPA